MESAGIPLVFTTPDCTHAALQALLWEEREKEPWGCTMWASAACRTHISAFIFVNYSGNDGAVTRQKRSFPSPDRSAPLPSTLILPSPGVCHIASLSLHLCLKPSMVSLHPRLPVTAAVTLGQNMEAFGGNNPGVRALIIVFCFILQSPTCLVREHPRACQSEAACAKEESDPPGCPDGRGLELNLHQRSLGVKSR